VGGLRTPEPCRQSCDDAQPMHMTTPKTKPMESSGPQSLV
jgi:hypothetical protein